jgi:hypothetical protein
MTETTGDQTTTLSPLPAVATEVLAPNSTAAIFQEVLDEVQETKHMMAKKVIKERVLEIKRLETLLAKAKADLQKLLEKDPSEISLY